MVSAAMFPSNSPIPSEGDIPSSGGRLIAADGRELPLLHSRLTVDAKGGLARVILEQAFINSHADPIHVRYQLPLPADGAVSGFCFQIGDQRIVGEIDRKHRARERFEEALARGQTAAILEETRANLFQQEIGNLPAGATLIAEVLVDQPLAWLEEGAWEWRFPTVIGPRYLSEPGRVPDAKNVVVSIADAPLEHALTLELLIRDPITGQIESPSHALDIEDLDGERRVQLARSGVRLDRDVVVRWPVRAPAVGLALSSARPSRGHQGHAYGLLTLVPPRPEVALRSVPRDLIVLLDISGSMSGRPIEQAQRVTLALIDSLGAQDQLELIAFSTEPQRFKREAIVATRDGKAEASRWVRSLRAGGGTEMREAVLAAIEPIRDGAQRQVVLITDGYIGFEQEIVDAIIARLPRSSRLHTVGVGSAVNRALTGPAARAGAGVEVIIGLSEDPERAVKRLLARTAQPIVTELEIDGDALVARVPERLPDLFQGAPSKIALRLRPQGGEVRVRGRMAGGAFEMRAVVSALKLGEGNQAITALYGREWVADLDMRRRFDTNAEIDRQVEQIGLAFQIATRMTSWIAVHERVLVEPGSRPRTIEVPQELPDGLSIEGLGLRGAGGGGAKGMQTRAGVMPGRARAAASKAGKDADQAASRLELDDLSLADEEVSGELFEADGDEGAVSREQAPRAPSEAPPAVGGREAKRKARFAPPAAKPAPAPEPPPPPAQAAVPAGADDAPEEEAAEPAVDAISAAGAVQPSERAPADLGRAAVEVKQEAPDQIRVTGSFGVPSAPSTRRRSLLQRVLWRLLLLGLLGLGLWYLFRLFFGS